MVVDKPKGHLDATAGTDNMSQRADAAPGGYTAAFACVVS